MLNQEVQQLVEMVMLLGWESYIPFRSKVFTKGVIVNGFPRFYFVKMECCLEHVQVFYDCG